MRRSSLILLDAVSLTLILGGVLASEAVGQQGGDLAGQLRDLNVTVIPANSDQGKDLPKMLNNDARSRIRAANLRESKNWYALKSKEDWEKYKAPRIAALRDSLGQPAVPPRDLKVRVTRTLDGDGYRIENLVFESRPGLIVTANLYLPKDPPKSMAGILIVPSHHNPKQQGELQDMGMTWARHGSMVLVMDQLGHGERRAHPWVDASSFPSKFATSRQDYWYRYNTAMQLHLVGESLIGWMAWDYSRGIDLLLGRSGIDPQRIIVLGAVAGGGDPAAVTAALDPRITCLVPYNFGGPQPETVFPLPADADASFNYAGSGSWESTRNLRLSARDGFLPWVIVGSVAPRHLIHAHEFAWDKDRDPVWKRYQQIYRWYGVPDRLDVAHGKGTLSGKPPESSHCNNIGFEHRKMLHPPLNRWFNLRATTESEFSKRRETAELICMTREAESALQPKPLHVVAAAVGQERAAAFRKKLSGMPADARVQALRQEWDKLLGGADPAMSPKASAPQTEKVGNVAVDKIVLEVDSGVVVPLVLLVPQRPGNVKLPVVIGFCHEGKQAMLKSRADAFAALLQGGVAVCLPDLRGTGESNPGGGRGRNSTATSISATELMLGRTLLGLRLRDLRSVLRYLRSRPELDSEKISLWGDSLAAANGPDVRIDVPWDAPKLPAQSEPLGGLLALLGALFEPDVRAVYAQGGLASYQSVLQSQFCYVPHDAIVPGALTAGDLSDIAGALAPRPLRLEGLVDGVNRPVPASELGRGYEPARLAYQAAKAEVRLQVEEKASNPAAWLLAQAK